MMLERPDGTKGLTGSRVAVLTDNLSEFTLLAEKLNGINIEVVQPHNYSIELLRELQEPLIVFVDAALLIGESKAISFEEVQAVFLKSTIILLTSEQFEAETLRLIKEGADGYLFYRNYSLHELVALISSATKLRLLQAEVASLKTDYENIFDQNSLPLLVIDSSSSQIIAVNKAAIDKYNYTAEEFAGLCLTDITNQPAMVDAVRVKFFDSDSCSCHYKKTGELMFVETAESPISYNNRTATLITVNDITQRILAAEEEKRAKQRLEAIFNGTHDAILLADDDGRFVQVNNAAHQMLGYSAEEFLKKSVAEILAPENFEGSKEDLWSSFLDTGTQHGVIELKRKDGTTIVCAYNASANVLPGLHLSILTDITDREMSRRKIDAQAARIDDILNSINDCFFAVNTDWTVSYWNKAAENVLRISKNEIVGKSLWNYFGNLKSTGLYAEFLKAMEHRVAIQCEHYLEGSDIWVEIAAYPTDEGLAIYFKDITSRKKQTLEILHARNQQSALINSTPDLIWSVDAEMKLTCFNTAFAERIKFAQGVVVGEGLQMPLSKKSPDEFERWQGYYKKALAGEAFVVEEIIPNPGGSSPKQAEINFTPVFDVEKDNVIGVACYSHEITERVRQQLVIEEQNRKLRLHDDYLEKLSAKLKKVLDSSLDIICSINAEGDFVQVSAACKPILGYEPEEMVGENYLKFLHSDSLESTTEAGRKIRAGAVYTDLKNIYVHKDGMLVPLIWSARWDAEEETMFCVARDASALIKAEQQKVESELRFRTLVQKGADVVGIIDEKGYYSYVSPNIKSIFFYEVDDLLGRNALELIHPDDLPEALEALKKVKSETEIKMESFRFKNGNDEWRWVETTATNQLDNPAIKGIVVTSRDITGRKRTEQERELIIEELLKSNSDLKQFSFITSHNLRAPLSNIVGILNIVNQESLDDFNKEMVEMLRTSSQQLSRTIDDLSKILIIKNNVNIDLTAIDLNDTFNRILSTFVNALNDVCADAIGEFEVPEIMFNRTYFESILVNLVSNSIKYRSQSRKLVIKLKSCVDSQGNTQLIYSDNGSGIDTKRHKSRLFGLYQRFHDSQEGHGLGLFIIKSQIVALGGKIEIESEVDKGTTFIITLKSAKGQQHEALSSDRQLEFS